MLQLIPIALFALASFSSVNAAPTGAAMMNEASPMMEEMSVDIMNSIPMNWKRNHHQQADILSGDFIDAAIAKAMSEQNMMMVKRQSNDSAPSFDLNTLFRGVFDNVINHIIEVTPLNDIVHGNYDFLYELFMNKVSEVISNIGSNIEKGPTEGKPFDLFGNPSLTTPPPAPGTEEPSDETEESDHDGDDEEEDDDEEVYDDEDEEDEDEEDYDDEDNWEEDDDEEDDDEDNEDWEEEDDEESHKHRDNDEEDDEE